MKLTSDQTDQFWPAFAATYRDIAPIAADAYNEPDGFRYASLDAIGRTVRRVASQYGLCVIQRPEVNYAADQIAVTVTVRSRLVHAASGQWVEPEPLSVPVSVPRDARAVGEAITYARKYHLSALFGVTVGQPDVDAARETGPTDEDKLNAAIGGEIARVGWERARSAWVNEPQSLAQRLVALRALPDAPEGEPTL